MIQKSGTGFSDKIMVKQEDRAHPGSIGMGFYRAG
jgi:hypothetical protein